MIHKFTKKNIFILIILISVLLLFTGCGEANNIESDLVSDEKKDQVELDQNDLEEPDESKTQTDDEVDTEANEKESLIVDGDLDVHFIDVGQGEATLLNGPDFTILIDAGRHDSNDVVPYLEKQGVAEIDLLIGTHPHADHIGQMDKVIESFKVNEVWMSGDEHTSQAFERVLDAILASDADYYEPRAGEDFYFGSSLVEVIHPEYVDGNLNDGSVSVRVTYGEVKFLFTGDVEQRERDIITRGHDIQADFFQLGHHGSSTSNTRQFLEAVNPDIAVYSAGENNSYGHPHGEVVDRINNMEITLYGTDIHGNIIVSTDGKSYTVHTEKDGSIVVNDTESESNKRSEGEGSEESSTESSKEDNNSSTGSCIDINTASIDQLIEIIHIGDVRAEELITLRPFQSVENLNKINGIGSGRLNEIIEEGLACVQ